MSNSSSITLGKRGRPVVSPDGRIMVVRIPISLRRQGGRKQVVTPANAAPWMPKPPRVDSTIIKAIVRAHHWRSMLEARLFGSVRELAKAEKINEAYLGRILRLTLLSPAITEAILAGQPPLGFGARRPAQAVSDRLESAKSIVRFTAMRRLGVRLSRNSRLPHLDSRPRRCNSCNLHLRG